MSVSPHAVNRSQHKIALGRDKRSEVGLRHLCAPGEIEQLKVRAVRKELTHTISVEAGGMIQAQFEKPALNLAGDESDQPVGNG